MNHNSEAVYYLANMQVESLPLQKPESFFTNSFQGFPKTISFFMFLKV